MTMLQTYSSTPSVSYDDVGQSFDLSYFIGILKRRIRYFAIPFLLILMLGSAVVAIQRPIYQAEGKILVESPEIPPDLVHPTITEVAAERVQVIQQRIMARDNLSAVVSKFNLFPRERAWMSGTELLELMRSRLEIKPIELDAQMARPNNPTIAFTLTFDYEVPELAMKVANEFLTSILSDDASTRTNNASETTKFLDREVKRLESEHDAVAAQIAGLKQRPPDQKQAESEVVKTQMKSLADLEAELVQKSSVYSEAHPIVRNLKKNIAALKRAIAAAPQPVAAKADSGPSVEVATDVLERRQLDLEKSLEDANRKLTTARLGESMERGQQGERLQVIEQPSLPQRPVRPKRLKWFAAAFVLAGMTGAACVFAIEMLDGSIRGSSALAGIVDRNLILTIPYLATAGEERRKRRNFILLCMALVGVLAAVIVAAVIKGITVDFSWFDHSLIDTVTRLLH